MQDERSLSVENIKPQPGGCQENFAAKHTVPRYPLTQAPSKYEENTVKRNTCAQPACALGQGSAGFCVLRHRLDAPAVLVFRVGPKQRLECTLHL